jgi:hypothetical protein
MQTVRPGYQKLKNNPMPATYHGHLILNFITPKIFGKKANIVNVFTVLLHQGHYDYRLWNSFDYPLSLLFLLQHVSILMNHHQEIYIQYQKLLHLQRIGYFLDLINYLFALFLLLSLWFDY